MKKRIISLTLALLFIASVSPVSAPAEASVQNHPGLRLQTLLFDPPSWTGSAVWRTQSWGGENIIHNGEWVTLTIRDYYFNGHLNFEVRHTGSGDKPFSIGLRSNRHGMPVTVSWNAASAGRALTATPEWQTFSLSIKALMDANPTTAFSLDDLYYIPVTGVTGTPIELRNVTISSPDDERQYPFVKVNQAGYEINSPKPARVSYFSKFGSLNGKEFQVINAATGAVAFTGTLPNAVSDASSGEQMHIISFDSLKTPGEYFIRIPNAGLSASARSPRDVWEGLNVNTVESVRFTIGNNVYEPLLTDLMRYFYFQRQGLALEAKYAGDFARPNLHPNDIAVKKWSDRNNPNAVTHDVSQGWYDAGDYGKYIAPAASTLSDLLFAYELFPEVFNNLSLNIPETDPSNPRFSTAPGALSEIKWELDMLLKFEHPSKDGSFYIAANYDGNTIYVEDTRNRSVTHTSPASDRDLRSHSATAHAAAALAHAYIVYKDVPGYTAFANQCLATAIRAWNWVTNPANPKNTSIGAANRTYTFDQPDFDRDMFWAAGALHRAVRASGGNTAAYEKYIVDNFTNQNVLRCFDPWTSLSYSHGGKSFKGFVHYLYNNQTPNAAVRDRFAASNGFAGWRATILTHSIWGTAYPTWGYWWGSNAVIAQNSMSLMLGSMVLEGLDKLPSNIVRNMENTAHHLLGINPMSFSYVSGHGENSVMNIYSAIFSHDRRLNPYRIPPGYFTEGSNIYNNRNLSKFDGKC